jgi:hypothetical protein
MTAAAKRNEDLRKASTKKAPEPRTWHVGDKVIKQGMQGPYEITRISPSGVEVDLCLAGTDFFELFRVRTELISPAKG